MDDNGNSIVVWTHPIDGVRKLFRAEYRNNNWQSFSSDDEALNLNSSIQVTHLVNMSSEGNAFIVWSEGEQETTQMKVLTYSNGSWIYPNTTNESEIPLIEGSVGLGYGSPVLSMNDSGSAILGRIERRIGESGEEIQQAFISVYSKILEQ